MPDKLNGADAFEIYGVRWPCIYICQSGEEKKTTNQNGCTQWPQKRKKQQQILHYFQKFFATNQIHIEWNGC